MRIYQPMLFVGLGGTGARVGAELERALRRELCGPDGTALSGSSGRAPFQLPECLQFVYADFSEAQLAQLPHMSVRGTEQAAYRRTSRAIHDLLPAGFDASTEVTRMLRINMHEEIAGWLPPMAGQPRVAPLNKGAGQLPTVGRASLFASLQQGLEPVRRQLREAIGAIAACAGDLREVGGGRIRGCDVFVAFSVAGGTGAGIYYDFLHLIGEEFRQSRVPGVKIYPLVVMPSAFPPEQGGGREAELNASRALVDLSRLVDDQNVPRESDDGKESGRLGVSYPHHGRVTLRPATVQTGVLFSRTAGIRPEDLRRSITSLVMSLIGTELGDESGNGRGGDFQSFAEVFVNKSDKRSTPARNGIGYRGMSTSLAASLTVPVDDLAEIVSGRLLAAAVGGMVEAARKQSEYRIEQVHEMFVNAAIGPLWTREPHEVPVPDPVPKGVRDITQALRDRLQDMDEALTERDRDLGREVPRMVDDFNPAAAIRKLLGTLDPFCVEKLLTGLPGHPERVTEAGFTGMLENRRNEPERPEGVDLAAPQVPAVKRPMAGMAPARWGDPQVQNALDEQDAWYAWRTRRLWHRHWKDLEQRWRPVLQRTVKDVSELVRALRAHADEEGKFFAEKKQELYRDDRKGVSYLLPPQNSLRLFYDAVFERLLQHMALPEGMHEAGLLASIVEPEDWHRALAALRNSKGAAVKVIKQVVERRVKQLFVETGVLNQRPLLPSLAELLRAAAGNEEDASAVDAEWLEQFRSQLAGLLPVGFVPDGNGPLKVLIVHPQSDAATSAERYLKQQLALPHDNDMEVECRPVSTDSINVVLFRSGMGLTDISEVRKVLRMWAKSRDSGGSEDFLDWRQRLGHRDNWLASTEEDRQRILHRLLCVLWNGRVQTKGDPASPRAIRIRLQPGDDAATMTLSLESYDDGVSSWAGLLRAYEEWALLDEGRVVDDFAYQLMQAQPRGVTGAPVPPAELYRILVHEVAPQQRKLIRRLREEHGADAETWLAPMRHFWEETLPGALDLPFPGVKAPIRRNLSALEVRKQEQNPGPCDGDMPEENEWTTPGAVPERALPEPEAEAEARWDVESRSEPKPDNGNAPGGDSRWSSWDDDLGGRNGNGRPGSDDEGDWR
jgi:hypothetical protein